MEQRLSWGVMSARATETINEREKRAVVWNRFGSLYRLEVPEPASPWTSKKKLGVWLIRAPYLWGPVTSTNWDTDWFEPSLKSSALEASHVHVSHLFKSCISTFSKNSSDFSQTDTSLRWKNIWSSARPGKSTEHITDRTCATWTRQHYRHSTHASACAVLPLHLAPHQQPSHAPCLCGADRGRDEQQLFNLLVIKRSILVFLVHWVQWQILFFTHWGGKKSNIKSHRKHIFWDSQCQIPESRVMWQETGFSWS